MKTNNKCPSCKSPNYIVSVFGSICQICYYDSSKEAPSPQPEEQHQPYCTCVQCEPSLPEEWESSFDKEFPKQVYILNLVGDYDLASKDIKSFIKTEIRKAEERKLDDVYEKIGELYQSYEGEWEIRTQHKVLDDVSKIIEALKKQIYEKTKDNKTKEQP